jgi:hypothetical protein
MLSMKYSDALRQLSEWTRLSAGSPIELPCGKEYSFGVVRQYKQPELVDLEANYRLRLPCAYREFLVLVGAGLFFSTSEPVPSGIEFRRIDDVCAMLSRLSPLREIGEPFPFLPVGADRTASQLLVFGLVEGGYRFFRVESPSASWDDFGVDERSETDFQVWLVELVSSCL